MNEKKAIIWIGLAKVRVLNESNILKGNECAFTNAIGLAKTRTEFRKIVKAKLYTMELNLIRLEDTEPLSIRLKKNELNKDIIQLSRCLSDDNIIEFSTFHTFAT